MGAAALLLAGCSTGAGATATAADAEGAGAAPSTAPSGAADFEAYRQCLSDNGIDVSALGGFAGGQRPTGMPTDRPTDLPMDFPSGMPTDRPGMPGGPPGMDAPEGVDEQAWQAAQAACADLAPSRGPGMGVPGGPGAAADFQVFWSCMADHDVDPPGRGAPRTSTAPMPPSPLRWPSATSCSRWARGPRADREGGGGYRFESRSRPRPTYPACRVPSRSAGSAVTGH